MKRFPAYDVPEFDVFKKLDTPAKVQDFLETFPINFEAHGSTCHSPLYVLRHKKAQCLEGALLAAAIFWYHGERPLLLDLETTDDDDDHVVALFKQDGCWGAVSKTNHAVLRYRDPVFKTIRELVLSYFSEYFLDDGRKTLRRYSEPFDMLQFEDAWLTSRRHMWNIEDEIIKSPHKKILTPRQIRRLRPADPIESAAGKLVAWKKKEK